MIFPRDRKLLGYNEAAGSGAAVLSDDAAPSASQIFEAKVFRNVRGIIFDFDGTLFDNKLFPMYLIWSYFPDILRVWRERLVRRRFEGRDFSTPEKYYRAFFGILGRACHRPPHVMRNWYFKHFMPRMIRVLKNYYSFRPGVHELLMRLNGPAGAAQLPAGFPAMAFYSDYPFLRERIQALGAPVGPNLRLYGPESFGAQKPASRPFLMIARDMGLRPEEILVIGDRDDTDGQGAHNAGMRFLCLKTGRRRYFKLDPYRNYPQSEEQQSGPILPLYSATWDELKELYNIRSRSKP